MTAHRGAAGPYIEYDGLPVLHATETGLPLMHPYGSVAAGRYITPGGGRLTIEAAGAHHRVTLDHLGCEAQVTPEKDDAFRRLALAAEGRCLQAGCKHLASYQGGVFRHFEVVSGSIELSVFVRALLAIELSDFGPANRIATETAGIVGDTQ
ncbi:DUF6420 family protein [Streptomyces sp. NPDC086796]|uniref:DUF6420 family protein n=1 Tax=Streptomyces sp. NPDC086796 TaxID=3365760 RepID=UPI00381FBD16